MRHPALASTLASLLTAVLLVLACFGVQETRAISRSLAGTIDWHNRLIGPIRSAQFAVTQSSAKTTNGSSREVIVTTSKAPSQEDVIATLDAQTGQVIWSQVVGDVQDPSSVSYHVADDAVYIISGSKSPVIHSFSLGTGHAIWQTPIPSAYRQQQTRQQPDSGDNGAQIVSADASSILALVGDKVIKLDKQTGNVQWTWFDTLADQSTCSPSHIEVVNESRAYLVAVINSVASPQLGMVTLDLENGTPIGDKHIKPLPANIALPTDYLVIPASTDRLNPTLVWLDAQSQKVASVDIDDRAKPGKASLSPKGGYKSISDIGLLQRGVVLAQHETGSDVLEISPSNIKVSTSFLPSDLVGCSQNGADALKVNVPATLTSDAARKGLKSIQSIVSDVRMFYNEKGSVQGWKDGKLLWDREEALNDILATVVVELPEDKLGRDAIVGALQDDEGFLARSQRHLKQLIYLPGYVTSLITRFTSGSYAQSLSSKPLQMDHLHRDQFGFQKLVIALTRNGQLFALDSTHGTVVWKSDLSSTLQLPLYGMWNVRSGLEFETPVVSIVATAQDGSVDTVAVQVNAFTGEVESHKVYPGTSLAVFPIPVKHCKTHIQALAIVAKQDLSVKFSPSCNKIKTGFANISSETFFLGAADTSKGYGIHYDATENQFTAYPVWQTASVGEQPPRAVAGVQQGEVASYGHVLGDRTTMYKYLNPHLVASINVLDSGNEAQVRVIDSITGAVVHSALIPGFSTQHKVQISLAENWLVYAYTEKGLPGKTTGGQRLVTTELFEGELPDQRTNSLSQSSLSGKPDVHAVTKTFLVPVGIEAIAMTTSKHGITLKDLLVATDRGQILAVPHQHLNPRRPIVPSAKDKEEMLIPYTPLLIIDPKWTVSHINYLGQIDHILTFSSLLESTSMVFAHGPLGLFGSRVTPSGTFDILSDSFNKTQLMLTILGLAFGIAIARPAVRNKMLKARWF